MTQGPEEGEFTDLKERLYEIEFAYVNLLCKLANLFLNAADWSETPGAERQDAQDAIQEASALNHQMLMEMKA